MAKKKIVNSVPRFIPPDKLSAAADRQRRISSRRRSRSGSLININETQVSRTSPSFERISVGDPIVRSVGIHGLGEENRVNDSCNGLPSVTSKGLSRVSLNHYFLLSRVATNGELETVDFSIGLSDLDPRFSMLGSDCNQNQFTPDPTASTSQGGCFSDYCSGFQGPYMSQPSYPYATHVAEPSPQPQQVAQENLDPLPSQRYGIDDQRHMRNIYAPLNLGGPYYICQNCSAHMWYDERSDISKRPRKPEFTLCCKRGMIQLPRHMSPPPYLQYLLNRDSGALGRHFRDNIRVYNSLFQFTSLGGKIDNSVNDGRGPYIFRLNAQTYHRIGPLLPDEGRAPQFAQLYICDTESEVSNRIEALAGDDNHGLINAELVEGLRNMLDQTNEIAKVFRTARERIQADGSVSVKIRFLSTRNDGERNYAAPVASEIAGLMFGDVSQGDQQRDIIVHHRKEGLKKISTLHPLYMALQYPVLFPYGQDGFRLGLRYTDCPQRAALQRRTVTMREFYSYQLQMRDLASNTLLRGGRLFQQYCVDAFSAVDQGRLMYNLTHQKELRADMYINVRDAINRGDISGGNIGTRIVLPASYTGGSRYMFQNYQDALAICRTYGYPDLFITFTCNPRWSEILQTLELCGNDRPEDRPDLLARVFRLKLRQLKHDLTDGQFFGGAMGVTYTVEFQKRGLPHAHILLWLDNDSKCKTTAYIDRIISAELPDPKTDFIAYQAVTNFMIHGPCGNANRNSGCMKEGKCSKRFPKTFQSHTFIDQSGFPIYRRRDTGIICVKNGLQLDNRFIVPHNVDLVIKYDAHINVEICCKTSAIKYLFKYINKGPDRARIAFERVAPQQGAEQQNNGVVFDEIQSYLDVRYISAPEACWRLFEFDLHLREPSVQRLSIHLLGQHNIYFNDRANLEGVMRRPDVHKTMFTQWMETNRLYPHARNLLYADFPTEWVWSQKDMKWHPRKQGRSVGRIIHISPFSGELYYLRLLLNVVRGARIYAEIRTVNGITYPTFQRACEVLGLAGDDREWREAIIQTSHSSSSPHVRVLFVEILMNSDITDKRAFFEACWSYMGDDIQYRYRQTYTAPNNIICDQDLRDHVLVALEDILTANNSSLARQKLPLPRPNHRTLPEDHALFQEMNYDIAELRNQSQRMSQDLNPEQRVVYDAVLSSVNNDEARLFFVYGYGGTGKTFLWNSIISTVRAAGQIVLAVASSGIASLLLPGGRTGHSRFKIPLEIDEY